MPINGFQQQGANNGGSDKLALFLKVFGGETLAAFTRTTKVLNNHIVKTIEYGKSATFPVTGRATARYLAPGASLDDGRAEIKHTEKEIHIDGLLTADVVITDIYEALSHVDFRREYTKQLGEELALAADGAVLAELAKLAKQTQPNLAGLGAGTIIAKTLPSGSTAGISEAYGNQVIQSLLEVRDKFSTNYVPMEDRFVYMTPQAINSVIASKDAINKNYGAVATIIDGNIDKLLGFKVVEVPHLTQGGANYTGAIAHGSNAHAFPSDLKTKTAFIAAHRSAAGTVKRKNLKIEHARRIDIQADHIVAKYAYGHGGLRPEAVALVTIGA